MSGRRVSYPQQARVVGTALQNRVDWAVTGDLLDSVQGDGDVLVGQLALQRKCGRGHHDPLALVLSEPAQHRYEIPERLPGARSRLDEQMRTRVESVGDRVSHLRLTPALGATYRPHG